MSDGSSLEKSASEACTRAGSFALLLTVALVSLVPLWLHRRDEISLGRYLALRFDLAVALQALDDDPLWQEWKRNHETESVSIDQLSKLKVDSQTLAPTGNARVPSQEGMLQRVSYSSIQYGPTYPAGDPRAPKPPTNLHFIFQFPEAQQIVGCLTGLNDSNLLTRSRKASDYFDLSIYRWALKRNNLIAQSLRNGPTHSLTSGTYSDPTLPAGYTPAADITALLGLSLSAVRELASTELPVVSNTLDLGRRGDEVEWGASSLPKTLFGASLSGQLLLFFVVVYFAAFAHVATSQEAFPSRETMFGAFAASSFTLLVFVTALWAPLAASLAILASSWGAVPGWGAIMLGLLSVLIGLGVQLSHNALRKRAYFRRLVHPFRAHNATK